MRDGNYRRVTPLDLSKEEVSSISQINTLLAFLQENHPSTLDSLFKSTASEYDLSTLAPHKLTSLFIEEQYNALQLGKTNEQFVGSIKSSIPQGVKVEFAKHTSDLADRALEVGLTRSDCNSCDCDFWATSWNQLDPCAIACNSDACESGGGQDLYCMDSSAENYADFGECDYGGGLMNFLGNAVDVIGDVGNAIGWDNIWNSVWGADDDDNTSGGGGDPYAPPSDNEEEEGVNWGTIGLIALGVVAVGVGIYFVVRKK
jgi:hypothetical protein